MMKYQQRLLKTPPSSRDPVIRPTSKPTKNACTLKDVLQAVEEDFLTNNEIEAIREIENLLETVKEIIFEQDEDDANMRRFILNQFTHLMYLIKEVVDESDNNINIMF